MFREMRRYKQSVSREECEHILETEPRGVLSLLGDEGYPYGVPLDFYYEKGEECLYFHCAGEGHKIDAIRSCDKVCFTTWNQGFQKEGDWAWNVTSVVAFGRAALVEDPAVVREKVKKLALKYYPTEEEAEVALEQAIGRVHLIRLSIEHMTGKLVNEK